MNRDANTVTVYTADENGQYTKPYMAMVCSGGTDTPTGYWNTPVNYDWRLLSGPCYGQYATRIDGPYLFHSVPYYTQHKDDLEYDEFNKLGTRLRWAASGWRLWTCAGFTKTAPSAPGGHL